MLSAFGEPPASGNSRPARAAGAARSAATSARGSASSRRRRLRPSDTRAGSIRSEGTPSRRGRVTDGHEPVNRGARFSTNAVTPSMKSAVRAASCWIVASSSSWSSNRAERPGVELALGARVGARRAVGHAVGELLGGRLQLVVGDDAVDQAPLERLGAPGPSRRASPSRSRARTRSAPGSESDEPPSGTRPMFTNASMKYEDSAARTRSPASANEIPMPTAGPLTAVITGLGIVRRPSMIGWKWSRSARADVRAAVLGGLEARFEVRAGAERLPVAREDHGARVRIARRPARRPRAARRRSSVFAAFIASGRFSVIVVTAPWRSTWTVMGVIVL